jgi:hypothetical protein
MPNTTKRHVEGLPPTPNTTQIKEFLVKIGQHDRFSEIQRQVKDAGLSKSVSAAETLRRCWMWAWENRPEEAKKFAEELAALRRKPEEIEALVRKKGAKAKWEDILDWVAHWVETPIAKIPISKFPDPRAVGVLSTAQSDERTRKEFYARLNDIKKREKDRDTEVKERRQRIDDKRATAELLREFDRAYAAS